MLQLPKLTEALALLRAGQPVLVFDGADREGETDVLFAGHLVQPASVRTLRRDAGGLVFCAVDAPVARGFGLPFVQDLHAELAGAHPVLRALQPGKLPYDARSSFSLSINHRDTFTGITDRDRALTIRRLAELAAQGPGVEALGREFRAPGHVALCVASEPLLVARRGHTELACALGRMAGVPGVLAGAEMLDGDGALPRSAARAWADAHGTVLLTGEDVAAAWASFIASRTDGPA